MIQARGGMHVSPAPAPARRRVPSGTGNAARARTPFRTNSTVGALLLLLLASPALGASDREAWRSEFFGNIFDPWFVFGMAAQGMFFLRFIIQWIVSEKRRRSTIPIMFWYFSLAGAVSTFIYAVHEAQPVFMLGQLLACVIYVRNLMLIHSRATRRRLAGLPDEDPDSYTGEPDPAGNRG